MELQLSVNTQAPIQESFAIEIQEQLNSYKVLGSFQSVQGNIIITSQNIRFDPGFPGLI